MNGGGEGGLANWLRVQGGVVTVRFHSFDTGMCSLQRSLRCHTHFPDPPHTHTCATPRFAAGGSGEAVTALSNTGRGGGGGGGDRRTTMAAIKDEGLGQGEKPDWIVVGGGRGQRGAGIRGGMATASFAAGAGP